MWRTLNFIIFSCKITRINRTYFQHQVEKKLILECFWIFSYIFFRKMRLSVLKHWNYLTSSHVPFQINPISCLCEKVITATLTGLLSDWQCWFHTTFSRWGRRSKFNNPDFKGHPKRIPKLINVQNLCNKFQSLC